LFKAFKGIADKKKHVTDQDIHALIQNSEHDKHVAYHLETLQLQFVSNGLQSAVVVVRDNNDQHYQDSSIGTGSIVAIYNAVDRIFNVESVLLDYRIDAVSEGRDAQAEVHVQVEVN
ncbi:2-isopropylmalate synthase, partial [Staphylococcus pseudintermedius]